MSEIISGDAGKVAPRVRGDYSDTELYEAIDIVYYKGSSYISKKDTIGNPPAEDSEYWHIFASGAEGDFASKEIYGDASINLGRVKGSSIGEKGIAFGSDVKAEGIRATALGNQTESLGENSFSTGSKTVSSGECSSSFGRKNTSLGAESASFGMNNVSVDDYSFSEGCGNVALGYGSCAENCQNISGAKYVFKIASYDPVEKKFTFDDTFKGFSDSWSVLSLGDELHIANTNFIDSASIYKIYDVGTDGKSVYVKESIPTSNFKVLYATLIKSDANYPGCHAEGRSNLIMGSYGRADGRENIVLENYGNASGYRTKALYNQHSQGHYNDISVAAATPSVSGASSGTAFVIGNGTSSTPSNAARIDYNGKLWCKQAYSSTGADYAELFEWADGNLDNEDRRGYFVTVEGKKIKKAQEGDYILGIISGNPSVIGNTDMEWRGQFMRDEFGTFIKENHKETITETDFDEDGNLIEVEKEVDVEFYKVNPDYDPDAPYTFRLDRPEWDAVGMIGVLPVRDDGTCEVGKFCKCADGGIATLSAERGFDTYIVIERVSENIVSVILK